MKMYLISDNIDTLTGMRLVGVEGSIAHTKEDLEKALHQCLSDENIGIILVTEKLGKDYPTSLDEVRLKRNFPLLIEIPDRHGSGRSPSFITDYIEQTIGIHVS